MEDHQIMMRITGDLGDRVVSSVRLTETDAQTLAQDIRAEIVDVLRSIGRDDVGVRVWAD